MKTYVFEVYNWANRSSRFVSCEADTAVEAYEYLMDGELSDLNPKKFGVLQDYDEKILEKVAALIVGTTKDIAPIAIRFDVIEDDLISGLAGIDVMKCDVCGVWRRRGDKAGGCYACPLRAE